MQIELDPQVQIDSLAEQVTEKSRAVARQAALIESLRGRLNEMNAVLTHHDLDFEEELEKIIHGHTHKQLLVEPAEDDTPKDT